MEKIVLGFDCISMARISRASPAQIKGIKKPKIQKLKPFLPGLGPKMFCRPVRKRATGTGLEVFLFCLRLDDDITFSPIIDYGYTTIKFPKGKDKNKKRHCISSTAILLPDKSDSALDLVGTQASGTGIHVARRTVHNGLNTLYVGLPSSIGTSVGVGNLNTKGNTLATIITLSHFVAPPIGQNSS